MSSVKTVTHYANQPRNVSYLSTESKENIDLLSSLPKQRDRTDSCTENVAVTQMHGVVLCTSVLTYYD